MDDEIFNFKISEYTGRVVIALKLGNREKAKKAAGTLLVLYRLQSRADANRLRNAAAEISAAERAMKRAEQSGIAFPLGEQRIEKLRQDLRIAKDGLAETGRGMSLVLDLWQSLGATLQDLCNLCNRDYERMKNKLERLENLDRTFSELVFVYNLDFKSNLDWLSLEVDAPLTHAIKEYHLDLILNTPEGREASREAFKHCFPEVWEKRLYTYTDADGITRVVDKDGVEVGIVEEDSHGP